MSELRAPFPYFGGKSSIAAAIWARLGRPKQYIEPFCGSAAMLLAAPSPASLEVVGDVNMYIANFWRAVRCQPDEVWVWQDYPVSHVDLYARHMWLTDPDRRAALVAALSDPEWPGDAQIAGWWVWGQCCWIGSGWCERERGLGQIPHASSAGMGLQAAGLGKIPHAGNAGMGLQAAGLGQIPHASSAGMGLQAAGLGKIPHAGNAGMGLQAAGLGKIPHASDAGRGLQAAGLGKIPRASDAGMEEISAHRAGARAWLHRLSARLERVRIVHGTWDRCLNSHYGADETAVFLDPPYLAFERLYAKDGASPVALDVARWAAENARLRVVICGHAGDYSGVLDGWETLRWERPGNAYGGNGTKADECVWFSPACLPAARQVSLFDRLETQGDTSDQL